MSINKLPDIQRLKIKKVLLVAAPVVLFFILLTDIAAYHLGADINWDLLNYHFYNGYLWMHDKLISGSINTIQSYLDPLLNSFYYILISTLTPLQVNLVIAALQSLSLTSVFFLSAIIFESSNFINKLMISFMVSLSALFGPVFWSEIGGTMGDTLLASPVIISIMFLVLATNTENSLRKRGYYVFLAGLLIGFVSGLKFTNMIYAVATFLSVAVVFTIIRLRYKDILLLLLVFTIAATLSFLATYWPVGWILWANFKNPIFPYYNGIFRSPYFAHYSFHDTRWFPAHFVGYLLMPFKFCAPTFFKTSPLHPIGMELNFRTYLYAIIFILLPFYAAKQIKLISRRKCDDHKGIFVVLFFVFSFAVWEIMFSYYRYIAVLEVIAPLTIMIMLSSVFDNFVKSRIIPVVLVFFIFALSATSVAPNWGREPFTDSYFGVNKQTFINYNKSLIIVGHTPIGFVLPYLPSGDTVVGIPEKWVSFTKAFKNKYMQNLHTFNGKMYYLSEYTKSLDLVKKHASFLKVSYGITINYNTCKAIKTNIYPIVLCAAARN